MKEPINNKYKRDFILKARIMLNKKAALPLANHQETKTVKNNLLN